MLSRLTPAGWLLLGIHSAFAAETLPQETDTVVVSATRTERSADQTLAPITVITRADIERAQARSAAELLSGQPGITLANNGGLGKATSVFLRGGNADHLLVLVDGVKIGSATTGTAALQDIPAELIERIEIVRGPRSSLYGSEALGGVIQIFTRRGSAALRPSAALSLGSYGTRQADAAISGAFSRAAWYSLGLSSLDSDGFNACRGRPSPNGAGCFTREPDRDGYHNRSARLRAGWRLTDGAEAELGWLRTRGENESDGGSVNQSEAAQDLFDARLRLAPTAQWHTTLSASRSTDESDNFKNGRFKSRFDTQREQFSWQNEITLAPAQQLVAGLDWTRDRVDSTTAYAENARRNSGLFAQYLAAFAAHDFQLALRRDHNQQFGDHNTGSAAWSYRLSRELRFSASYGTAFKAPTFNQLYFPGFGNAALRPELARSIDLGLSATSATGQATVNAFETRVSDLIGFDATFSPVNIDSARIRGVEATAALRAAEWDWRANLTLLDPENRAEGSNHGKLLPRRPRQSLALSADHEFGAWSTGASLRAVGQRYDNLANSVPLAGYATLDLRAEYRLDPAWRLQLRIENLFDRAYETAYLYNQTGRGAYLTLRYAAR